MACVYLERRQILRLPLALGLPCLPFPLENDTKMEPVATSGPTMRGSGEKEIRGAGGGRPATAKDAASNPILTSCDLIA